MSNVPRFTVVYGDHGELTFNRINPQTDLYAATIISPQPFYSPAFLPSIEQPPIDDLLVELGVEDLRGVMTVAPLTYQLTSCPELEATHLQITLQGEDQKTAQALFGAAACHRLRWFDDRVEPGMKWLFELTGSLHDWHQHFCAYLARSRHLSELHCESLVKALCARGYRFRYKAVDDRQVLDFHRADTGYEQVTEYKSGLVRSQDLVDGVGRSLAFAVECEKSGKDPQAIWRERAASLMQTALYHQGVNLP